MYLEQAISESPTGECGVIHITRDIASYLGSRLIYKRGEDSYSGQVMTRLGTKVVIGSGYTGGGPIGTAGAAPSATNKWMYATGKVEVHLGKSEIVNTTPEGVDATINNMTIKAFRPRRCSLSPQCTSRCERQSQPPNQQN